MSKMIIHKNKGEIFKCHFDVEGVDYSDVNVRLCLEFEDNRNLYFYGKLSEDGECEIQIPKLLDLKSPSGKLVVEAVADTNYFKLYECEFDLKKSIEVKMEDPSFGEKKAETSKAKVTMANIEIKEEPTVAPAITEEPTPKKTENPYVPQKVKKPVQESKEPKPGESGFNNYLRRQQK